MAIDKLKTDARQAHLAYEDEGHLNESQENTPPITGKVQNVSNTMEQTDENEDSLLVSPVSEKSVHELDDNELCDIAKMLGAQLDQHNPVVAQGDKTRAHNSILDKDVSETAFERRSSDFFSNGIDDNFNFDNDALLNVAALKALQLDTSLCPSLGLDSTGCEAESSEEDWFTSVHDKDCKVSNDRFDTTGKSCLIEMKSHSLELGFPDTTSSNTSFRESEALGHSLAESFVGSDGEDLSDVDEDDKCVHTTIEQFESASHTSDQKFTIMSDMKGGISPQNSVTALSQLTTPESAPNGAKSGYDPATSAQGFSGTDSKSTLSFRQRKYKCVFASPSFDSSLDYSRNTPNPSLCGDSLSPIGQKALEEHDINFAEALDLELSSPQIVTKPKPDGERFERTDNFTLSMGSVINTIANPAETDYLASRSRVRNHCVEQVWSKDNSYVDEVELALRQGANGSSYCSPLREEPTSHLDPGGRVVTSLPELCRTKKNLNARSAAFLERLQGASRRRNKKVSRSESFPAAVDFSLPVPLMSRPPVSAGKRRPRQSDNKVLLDQDPYKPFKARPVPLASRPLGMAGQLGLPKIEKQAPTIPKSPRLGRRHIVTKTSSEEAIEVRRSMDLTKKIHHAAKSKAKRTVLVVKPLSRILHGVRNEAHAQPRATAKKSGHCVAPNLKSTQRAASRHTLECQKTVQLEKKRKSAQAERRALIAMTEAELRTLRNTLR
jgi:hypothetical protein